MPAVMAEMPVPKAIDPDTAGTASSLRWAGRAQIVECDMAVEYGDRKIRHQPQSLARAIRALVRAGRP